MADLEYDKYLLRRKILRLFGAAFHIYNEQGELQFYVNQKGFKLKEDIRVFTSEDMTEEIILISARNAIDFSATYDVMDSTTGERLGSLKRKGFKSMLKDEWIIQDINDNSIGDIKEDSMVLALVRRILTNLVPQTFIGSVKEAKVFSLKQNFNPFVQKMSLDFSYDTNHLLDKKLGIAAAILICAIEGKQQ